MTITYVGYENDCTVRLDNFGFQNKDVYLSNEQLQFVKLKETN